VVASILPSGLPPDRDRQLRRACILQISTRQLADTVIAAPVGRIDHQTAAEFEAALMPLIADAVARHGAVVIDFSGVDYISSVGLRVLMVAARQVRAHQAQLLVAALQSVVAEIFAISRFDHVLTVTATLEEALARCSPAALAQLRDGGSPPAP
jgi:anti-sigma B factor antagonist